MIIDSILSGASKLLGTVLAILPDMSVLPSGFTTSWDSFSDFVATSLWLFPFMSSVWIVIGLMLTAVLAEYTIAIATWVASLFVPSMRQLKLKM